MIDESDRPVHTRLFLSLSHPLWLILIFVGAEHMRKRWLPKSCALGPTVLRVCVCLFLYAARYRVIITFIVITAVAFSALLMGCCTRTAPPAPFCFSTPVRARNVFRVGAERLGDSRRIARDDDGKGRCNGGSLLSYFRATRVFR